MLPRELTHDQRVAEDILSVEGNVGDRRMEESSSTLGNTSWLLDVVVHAKLENQSALDVWLGS